MLDWRLHKSGEYFMNQDALNAVLSSNVKEMDCWHNFLSFYPNVFLRQELEKFYDINLPKDIVKIYKKALILHYPGKTKPHMANMGYLTAEFMKYLRQTEFREFSDCGKIQNNQQNQKISLLDMFQRQGVKFGKNFRPIVKHVVDYPDFGRNLVNQ